MADDLLRTSLLELWGALPDCKSHVLLGGGYGLYLKQQQLAASGIRTLIAADLWPAPRATQDLDLLLRTELVGDTDSMTQVRETLDALGYQVLPACKFLQFQRRVGLAQEVKVDLLTAQLGELTNDPAIQADERRARPKSAGSKKLHAHPTDGAIDLGASGSTVIVEGVLADGTPATASVRLPHAFTYLLMKLTAYRDRKDDKKADLGQHHALDVFRIIAMLTFDELQEVRRRMESHRHDAQVTSCLQVASRDFLDRQDDGVRAMRRHPLWTNDDQLDIFFDALREALNLS